jgi:long-chain acyl-CoA synthetase
MAHTPRVRPRPRGTGKREPAAHEIKTMVRSVAHVFFHSAERHPQNRAFEEISGRTWSYAELKAAVEELALGFSTLGVRPGDRVGLFADNSIHWILCDLAILSIGAADVPRGTDTAPAEIDYLVRHSGARVVVLQDRKLLDELAPVLADIADLRCIVLQRGTYTEGDPRIVVGLDEVRERGRQRMRSGAQLTPLLEQIRDTDTATIVYTSGTTGKPKGVVLTHANVLHVIRAIPGVIEFGEEDVFLSILPAWHMFERIIEYAALSKGCRSVYTDKRHFRRDLERVKPTVIAAVPRLYEALYEETRKKLADQPRAKRWFVEFLLSWSTRYRSTCRLDPRTGRVECDGSWLFCLAAPLHRLADRLVYRKIREAFGGRLRALVSGGGSLPRHIDEFFDRIGMPLLNGYGLTETAPLIAVRRPGQRCLGTVGNPIPGTEIEIRGPDGKPVAPGQIGVLHVRGPQVMTGYYRDLGATQRAIDGRGFFDTGDLVCCYGSGDLAITGRAKDTIVLRGGENVEPEPIENQIRLSPYVLQVVVVGQDQKSIAALIVPDFEAIKVNQAIPATVGGSENAEPPPRDAVRALLATEIRRLVARESGFKPFEQVNRFAILDTPFSVEGGELTETLKLRRHVIAQKYHEEIAGIFAE